MRTLYGLLARRYLLGRRGRSIMTFTGLALGVTMVVAVTLTSGAIMASYENLLSGIAGRADLQISPLSGRAFPAAVLHEVSGVPGVGAAVPVVSSGSPVIHAGRKGTATFYGIDPVRDALIRDYRFTAGRQVAESATGELAISSELAAGLGVAVGDQVQLLSTTGLVPFTVAGIFDARGTVRGSLGPFGVMALADAQAVFGKPDQLDTIDILAGKNSDPAALTATLQAQLAGRVRAGTPMERSRDMQKLLDAVLFMLNMAGSISLFAGAFIIYTNVSMGVAERRRDLSILRALGMRRREVMTLVLTEAGLMGLAGAGFGLLLGYGLASTLAAELTGQFLVSYGVHATRVVVHLADVAAALTVGVGTSLLAAYIPGREAVQVSPVEAMRPAGSNGRHDEPVQRRWARTGLVLIIAAVGFIWMTWPAKGMLPPPLLRAWGLATMAALLGAVALLPALLLFCNRHLLQPLQMRVHGITGRLASDNLVRQPRRTAATVCALMISLTFMVGMGGTGTSQRATFDAWWQRVVGWDLNISTSYTGFTAQVEMAPSFWQDLAQVPGVKLVSPQTFGRVVLADQEQAFLYAFDHALLRQYSEADLEEGDWPAVADAMVQGGGAIISPPVARRLGLKLGDTLALPTPVGEQNFRVVGIMRDMVPYGGTVQIDRRDYRRYWQDDTATNVAVVLTDKSRTEEVRQAILQRWGTRANLLIRSNQEYWQSVRQQYDGFYRLMDGLTWIAILVSGLALANTLFASLMERKREFGILRAIGTRRREVMRVVLGEAFATGLVGGVLGVAAGLLVQLLFVRSAEFINGTHIDLVIPTGYLALAALVALVLAPLAGLLPARWAARLDVVEALRYE